MVSPAFLSTPGHPASGISTGGRWEYIITLVTTHAVRFRQMRYTLNMSDTSPERVGLFGGTFDPPHIGHLILASEAKFQLQLNRVLWTVTPDPPHKQDQPITPLEHRLSMVKLAIQDNPAFELSRVELDRPGP